MSAEGVTPLEARVRRALLGEADILAQEADGLRALGEELGKLSEASQVVVEQLLLRSRK